jgi:hypothetical protein
MNPVDLLIGVPDPRFGEELCAWIIPRPGASLDADAVRSFCAGQIARYKVPPYIKFADEFPPGADATLASKPRWQQPARGRCTAAHLRPALREDQKNRRTVCPSGSREGSLSTSAL